MSVLAVFAALELDRRLAGEAGVGHHSLDVHLDELGDFLKLESLGEVGRQLQGRTSTPILAIGANLTVYGPEIPNTTAGGTPEGDLLARIVDAEAAPAERSTA